ncbi:transcription initiation factor TFIID subunit 1 [Biomphalaria glabrata]|nr:transcription initiation factor TFIID subunit 1 [Biomphalaria glabrata]
MGANQSNSGDVILPSGDNSIYHHGNHSGYHSSNYSRPSLEKRKKEKPSQPRKPIATHVTHDSITLSWSTPRNAAGHSIIAYTLEMVILSSAVDRQWRTVTKCCQGTSYEVRHLDPDTAYVFRVRAENVYGLSKPSLASDVITTNMFEIPPSYAQDSLAPLSSPPECTPSGDSSGQNFKRRHSFNVHLDGNITKMLNHTDVVLSATSASTPQSGERTLTRNTIFRTSLQNNRKISQPIILPGTGTNSLNRLRESRISLKSNSSTGVANKSREIVRNKFRDSCGSSGSTMSESNVSTSTEDLRKTDLGSLSSLQSDTTVSNCKDLHSESGSKHLSLDSFSDHSDRKNSYNSDSVDRKECLSKNVYNKETMYDHLDNKKEVISCYDKLGLSNDANSNLEVHSADKNFEITEEKLHMHDMFQERLNSSSLNSFGNSQTLRGYYENLESPWQKSDSLEGMSQQIMAAPICDDVKMAKMAMVNGSSKNGFTSSSECRPESVPHDGRRDFRTLRSVLQSNNMIVKSSRSLPDVASVVIGDNGEVVPFGKGRLTTIVDADEEEDTVRITTL